MVLERQIFLGVMELNANGFLSGQNCFSATCLLSRISLVAHKLTVSTHSLVTLHCMQFSEATNQTNGACIALLQRQKWTRAWEKGSFPWPLFLP